MNRPTPLATAPGQESVWDYPRPPRVEPSSRRVVIVLGGQVILDTDRAIRVLETSHPPSWYLPRADFVPGALQPGAGTSYCEFKGSAVYWDVIGGGVRMPAAAWSYPDPTAGFEGLIDHIALYPGRMDRCTIDGEEVRAQEGSFYGGWVTSDVVGPFKGGPGTAGW